MSKDQILEWLEGVWPENKAKGILAQVRFQKEIKTGSFAKFSRKYFKGCWILSPKRNDFYKFRFCFFVHPEVLELEDINCIEPEELLGEGEGLKFRMVAGYLKRAGFGVIYVVPKPVLMIRNSKPYKNSWDLFIYQEEDEALKKLDSKQFFINGLREGVLLMEKGGVSYLGTSIVNLMRIYF